MLIYYFVSQRKLSHLRKKLWKEVRRGRQSAMALPTGFGT